MMCINRYIANRKSCLKNEIFPYIRINYYPQYKAFFY